MLRLTMSEPTATLPAAPIFTWSRRPTPTSALCTAIRPSVSGVPTWSEYSSGAAPVPPSLPSTTTKSGPSPSSTMALQMASTSARRPTHSLMPTGLPPASSRSWATNATSSRGVWNAECPDGLMQSWPSGTPPHGGDLRGDLGRGQHAPDPRLRALGELERHALDGRVGGLVGEPRRVEPAVGRAGAEVAAAQLPHEVAAVEVVAGEAALAGV